MSKILHNWQQGRVAIVNGIALPDDSVRTVPARGWSRATPTRLDICGNAIPVPDDVEWTDVSMLAKTVSPCCGYLAVAGECGMGGDGFMALIDERTALPEWIAFFDFSNPFEAVAINDTHVLASNNLGESWSVPRSATGTIEIALRIPAGMTT